MHPSESRSAIYHDPVPTDERFRQLVDSAPFMFWSSGPDALCTFFNRPWLEFRGRTMAQELGDGWLEGVHPEDLNRCVESYLGAFHARELFRSRYRMRRADGEYCWISDSGIPQYTQDCTFLGYAGSCIQIEEPRQAPQSQAVMPLTAREVQVLALVADGKSTKQVASLLSISYKTADSHRSHIMEKLGVHETASMVRWAVRQGIVQP